MWDAKASPQNGKPPLSWGTRLDVLVGPDGERYQMAMDWAFEEGSDVIQSKF